MELSLMLLSLDRSLFKTFYITLAYSQIFLMPYDCDSLTEFSQYVEKILLDPNRWL